MLHRPIAVFDSGLGSLSVVRELRKIIPTENILYFADKMNFPYGVKTKGELKDIMVRSIKFLEKYQPKLIVMASNTPSIQIFDEIKNNFSIDIISTRLPLKKTINLSRKKHIAIMASRGTLVSKEFNYIVKKEVPQQIFVEKIDSSDIIDLVEDGKFLFDQKLTYQKIKNILKPHIDNTIDVVALCSTHLPLVKNYLEAILPSIKLVNSSTEVARDVKNYLKNIGDLNKYGTGKLEILVSADKNNFQSILRYMGVRELIFDVSLQL
ncbi:MAG TPA: glutamate racemase [Candidatus Nitrosocosmicus sp.]|nr:glutamate racemase [Candidatus Nitrosocosmicus sp.]